MNGASRICMVEHLHKDEFEGRACYGGDAWLGSKTARFTAGAGVVRASNRVAGALLMPAGLLMVGLKPGA